MHEHVSVALKHKRRNSLHTSYRSHNDAAQELNGRTLIHVRRRESSSCLSHKLRQLIALQGEICDIDGTCVDAADDEIFKLTTKEGSLSMEREKVQQPLHQTRLFVSCCLLCLQPTTSQPSYQYSTTQTV